MLSNILNNSVESITGGGIFEIDCKFSDGICVFIIRDNGVGIDPKILRQIGEKGFSFGKGDAGNGLGVHSAIRLLNTIGGDIRLSSQLGAGTEVTIAIPVKK